MVSFPYEKKGIDQLVTVSLSLFVKLITEKKLITEINLHLRYESKVIWCFEVFVILECRVSQAI